MSLNDAARAVLSRPPRVPLDVDLFTSNELFGQPGIYPNGSAMLPATDPAPDADHARRLLHEVLHARQPTPPGERIEATDVASRFDEPALVTAVPDPGVRAALLMLSGTVADAVVRSFPHQTEATSLRYGAPEGRGRVVGPPAADATHGPHERVVNDRYRGEHPALVAGSLAHDLLWNPAMTSHAAEAVLHLLVAMVHVQLVARDPSLARAGTELARRQNALAITLLNSRSPGSHRITPFAPDGPGTIPGGAPSMQTPDFWSVPFAPVGESDPSPLLVDVIGTLVMPDAQLPELLRVDESLGPWLSDNLDDRWLPVRAHLRATCALGLCTPADVASEAHVTVDEVCEHFGIGGDDESRPTP